MLTGELPLGKFQPPSQKVQVDVRLDEVVLHALEKEPERRYQQASQVKTAVETIVGSAAVPPARTTDKAWQSPTMGWGHFIGYLFGITFTSPLAFKLANLSALGFLGGLAFLGFVPLPGMHRCFGFLGFTGFFGLIGVAHLVELAARRKAQMPPRGRAMMVIAATVLSLLAILVASVLFLFSHHGNQAQTTAMNGAATDASPEIERAITTISQCSEGDPRVEESLKSLRSLDQSAVVAALEPYLDSPTDTRRRSAIYVLWKGGFTNIEPAVAKLQQLMKHEETYTRGMAALALGQNRVAKSFDALANMTGNDSSSYARRCAAYALGLLGDARAKPVLQAALQDHDPLVHDNAERALASLNRPPPSATAGTGPRIERVTVNADQAVVKGWGTTNGRITFSIGQNWQRCGFLENTGFTATLSHNGINKLNCTVNDASGNSLLTTTISKPDSASFSEGRIVFHEGTVAPEADGTCVVAELQQQSGVSLPITVRVGNAGASSALIMASASAETWSPTFAPGEKPDMNKILDDAKKLMELGKYEDALQRHLWYFNHALEYDQGQTGVRLSFALSQWVELGRRYPKAKEALTGIRDRDARMLMAGKGYANLFTDVQAINRELQDEDATYELFKMIREKDPQLAGQCYFWVESLLVAKGEYQWCYDHMGDPQFRFDSIRLSFDMECANQQRMAATQQKTRQMIAETNQKNGWTNVPSFSPPDTSTMLKKSTEDRFVGQVRQLIEILVATGHKSDAEKIRDQAVAVLDDARLKSALSDTEEKIQNRDAVPLPSSSAEDNGQTVAGLPPVVVETWPVSGTRDVEPGVAEIRVRFSKEMADGSWSWSTAWQESTPESVGPPHYLADHRTCVMKVRLEPGQTYAWWLNSDKFKNFTDLAGRSAVPYLLIFQTKPN